MSLRHTFWEETELSSLHSSNQDVDGNMLPVAEHHTEEDVESGDGQSELSSLDSQ